MASTYLITFVCYGGWLHGEVGALDRHHNTPGSPYPEADPVRLAKTRDRMKQPPYLLDALRRDVVLDAMREVCHFRGWTLLAAHVRTTHVHVVAQAGLDPELVMNAFKCYASRALNRAGLDGADPRRWARHGSTRHLWTKDEVSAAIRYVVCGQGEPMAVYDEGDAAAR